jgi:hypothetical protein
MAKRGRPKKVEDENGNEEKRKEIESLGLDVLSEYLSLDAEGMKKIEPKILNHIMTRAKLGMQIERELNIQKRASENNHIRIFKLIAEDKKELKKLIKESLPTYYSG